jgi:hypothetical protein
MRPLGLEIGIEGSAEQRVRAAQFDVHARERGNDLNDGIVVYERRETNVDPTQMFLTLWRSEKGQDFVRRLIVLTIHDRCYLFK